MSPDVRSPAGRPPGAFKSQKQKLYQMLSRCPQPVQVSNGLLAYHLGVGTKQVSRYLRALQTEGQIVVRYKNVPIPGGAWCNNRSIYVESQTCNTSA